jgi:hypothetical protein
MASELATNVFTPGATPDYLGHYAELLKSIPNAGLQFLAAQKASAENANAQAQYEIAKQKAKAFIELYPAFKQAQIAKLNAEAATFPARQSLLESQAAYQRAHAASLDPGNYPSGNTYGLDVFDDAIAKAGKGGAPKRTFDPLAAGGAEAAVAPEAPPADVPPSGAPVMKLGDINPTLQ